MSAMNCFIGTNDVHLFTDGANYDTDAGGEVRGISSKVLPIPHLCAVVCSVGTGWATTMIGVELTLTHVADLEDLIEAFPSIVLSTAQKAENIPAMPPIGITNFLLCGWSEVSGPVAYSLWTADMDGCRAYEMNQVRDYRSPSNRHIQRMDIRPHEDEQQGLALMQVQRDTLGVLRDGSNRCGHLVGGFCQHTVVSKDGIYMKAIHRWDDSIGAAIMAPKAKEGVLFA